LRCSYAHVRAVDVKVLVGRLEASQLESVEVVEELFDLIRAVDVRDGIDPMSEKKPDRYNEEKKAILNYVCFSSDRAINLFVPLD
jgi:hypothetical protein